MHIFKQVMNDQKLLKKNTEQEVQRFLSRGGAPIYGYSHLDYRNKNASTQEDFNDSCRGLWKVMSDQLFMNHD